MTADDFHAQMRQERDRARWQQENRPHPHDCLCRHCYVPGDAR